MSIIIAGHSGFFLQLYAAWVDPLSGKGRPIADLEAALEAGEFRIAPNGELVVVAEDSSIETHAWSELDEADRREVIDKQRLAFIDEVPVNWCPGLGTVLANEEVTNDGRSERGNFPVFKRPLRQWMLRITSYADRLLDDLDVVDWPEAIKLMQRNWIGKSVGAAVQFKLDCGPDSVADGFAIEVLHHAAGHPVWRYLHGAGA